MAECGIVVSSVRPSPLEDSIRSTFQVSNQPLLRTVTFRASGALSLSDALRAEREGQIIIDSYRGRPHLVMADVRGLMPSSPAVAEVMQRIIQYSRQRGTVCCVHLYDSAITRLQAARLAREATRDIDGTLTVEVVSVEEAEEVLREQRFLLESQG